MHMIQKGQINGVGKGDIQGQLNLTKNGWKQFLKIPHGYHEIFLQQKQKQRAKIIES